MFTKFLAWWYKGFKHLFPLNLKRKDSRVLIPGSAEPDNEIIAGERKWLTMMMMMMMTVIKYMWTRMRGESPAWRPPVCYSVQLPTYQVGLPTSSVTNHHWYLMLWRGGVRYATSHIGNCSAANLVYSCSICLQLTINTHCRTATDR